MIRELQLALLVLLLTAASAHAQSNTTFRTFPGVPTGICSGISFAINAATGDFYDCFLGNWFKVGPVAAGVFPNNEPGAANNFLTAYNSTTGNFSKAQPTWANIDKTVSSLADLATRACANLSDSGSLCTSSGPLPSNEAGATNDFLTAYNSGTGAFSKAQPTWVNIDKTISSLSDLTTRACANLSDAGTGCSGAAYPGLVAHNLLSVSHGDTTASAAVLGGTIYADATPKWVQLAGNTTAVKQWLSQTGTGAVSAAPGWSDVKLDELSNPSGNKTFTMASKALQFTFTNPSNAPTYDGAFEIEATGAFTGDLLHLHQHTGNPGAGTDMLHIETADVDVLPIHIISAGTYGIQTDKPIDVTIATGTAPLVVASTTEVANLHAATATALAANPADCAPGTFANAIAANGDLTCASVTASLPSGLIAFVASGSCPAGFTEVAGLSGKFVLGTTNGAGDVGTTGGSTAYTPAGTIDVVVDDHASHTHTYTDVPNHVHVQTLPSVQTGSFASGTRDTSSGGTGGTPSTVADAVSTATNTGGVATGTTNGPSAALTHNVSTKTFSGTPATITPPYIKLIGCSAN